MTPVVTRRAVLAGGLGAAVASVLPACAAGPDSSAPNAAGTGVPGGQASLNPLPGRTRVSAQLTAEPATVDLGGLQVPTWTFGKSVPGPLLRATAGDLLDIVVDNRLPQPSSVHWHGIRLRNAADGVSGVTQDAIAPRGQFRYTFVAPDPGTYFFHPHSGVQLDRGLYAPLIIDDPNDPGDYDVEWVVVLDDWIDGTGRTPEDVLAQLTAGRPSMPGGGATGTTGSIAPNGSNDMSGMPGMSAMSGPEPFGDAGDVSYPHYLINGRIPAAPAILEGTPGQRARLRVINAAADTIFTVALAEHQLTVTDTDGHPVTPTATAAIHLGMGERYDLITTLRDGVFPLTAHPFGKSGYARALVRTNPTSSAPPSDPPPAAPTQALQGSSLSPHESSRLPVRPVDATATVTLGGQMQPYQWTINDAGYGRNQPLTVRAGQRLRLTVRNQTMMAHPVHLHGHTFALSPSGLRKDTVLLRPMETQTWDVDADNPGAWIAHCHNLYHAEAGMMIRLDYAR